MNKLNSLQIILRKFPIATSKFDNIDVISCINAFEGGCKNIYITDAPQNAGGGGYLTLNKTQFSLFMKNGNATLFHTPSIKLEFLLKAKKEQNFTELNQKISYIFGNYPETDEIPITDDTGKICQVFEKVTPAPPPINWTTKEWSGPMSGLSGYKKIYLSSLENDSIRNFFRNYGNKLPLCFLDNNNLRTALTDDESLLVYGEDFFPNCKHKTSIIELYRKAISQAQDMQTRELTIYDMNADLPETELNDTVRLVREFDSGAQTITVTDTNGKFIGSLSTSIFSNSFPSKKYNIQYDLSVPKTNHDEILSKAYMVRARYGFVSVPVLENNRVVGMVARWGDGIAGENSVEKKKIQPLYWELISDKTLQQFFPPDKRTLLSSTCGDLNGLYERLSTLTNVEFFSESLLDEYLKGSFDILVYGADIWSLCPSAKYNAHTLYENFLELEISKYLRENDIHYYYFNIGAHPVDMDSRTKITKILASTGRILAGSRYDYSIYADIQNHLEGMNILGGRRLTVGTNPTAKQSVYFFGPCTAFGIAGIGDENTVESQLQILLNQNGLSCNAVNCGGSATPLDAMYRMMDMEFQSGDIVIFLGSINSELPLFSLRERYSLKDVFDGENSRFKKCFIDSPQHLTLDGNIVLAKYIFNLIQNDIKDTKCIKQIAPFGDRLKTSDKNINDDNLRQYLKNLSQERISAERVGAVVMNCNPFTKGHLHLIKTALKTVDFLYVFVVEEDKSEFSFKDRFAMVKANCEKLPCVKVLPSGKYMISVATFAAYFNKDALQEQTIVPAQDVRTCLVSSQ